MIQNKIRLTFKSPYHKILKSYTAFLILCLKINQLKSKIFWLPRKSLKLTVLRAPTVHKKAKIKYVSYMYSVFIDISAPLDQVEFTIFKYLINLPKNITVKISVL